MDPLLTAHFLSAFEIYPEEFKKVFCSIADSIGQLITKANDIDFNSRR
jgi:hypothetical protein